MRYSVRLNDAQTGHTAYTALWQTLKPLLLTGRRIDIEAKTETRSTAQNALLWAMLSDISRQVDWYGERLTAEEWKDVFTASLKKQKVVPSLDRSGFVMLGSRTSKMTIAEMSDLIELMNAFGAEHSVRFTAPEYMEE